MTTSSVTHPSFRLLQALLLVGVIATLPPLLTPRESAFAIPITQSETESEVRELGQQIGELYAAGRYAEAIPLAERFLELVEADLGTEHPDVATSLNVLADLYRLQGRYADAEPLYQRSLRIRENQFGADHPNVAHSINSLAELYRLQGRYEDAEPLYRRSLTIYENELGDEHLAVATSLNNLALLYQAQGRYEGAESLFQRSLTIFQRQLGEAHPAVATSLNNLASLYKDQGRYGDAEPLFQRSLRIREDQLGADHPDVAQSLNNLALLYHDLGRYIDAEPLFLRSLTINETTLGADHPAAATSLSNLASLYQRQGHYDKAEPLFLRSLAINERQLGADHPEVATSLNNLALLYQDQGRYTESESLYLRSLTLYESLFGSDHPKVAISLNNLAEFYQSQGRYGDAEPLYRRSLRIRESQLGDTHPDVAQSLNNLAGFYLAQGRYAEAEPLYRRSLTIYESQLGQNHPDVARSLNNLAELYRDQGNYDEAEPIYRRSLHIRETQLGVDHPDVAQSLNNLAGLYYFQQQYEHVIPLFEQASHIEENNLARLLAVGSEANKQDYLATLRFTTNLRHSLAQHHDSPEAVTLAFETLLRRKGRVLDAVAGSLQILRQQLANEPDVQQQLDELIAVRAQLSALINQGQRQHSPEAYQQAYHHLLDQEQILENALNQSSAAFVAIDEPITLDQVQALLPDNAVLVEFVRYQPFVPDVASIQKWDEPHYAAYLLKPSGVPDVINLGEAAAIDAAVTDFRQAVTNRMDAHRQAVDDVREKGHHLYQLLFSAMEAELAGTEHLLLSPDGLLNLIPFEALNTEQGQYLVQQYSLSYLTSGRDLLQFQVPAESHQGPVIFASPDYDQAEPHVALSPTSIETPFTPPRPATTHRGDRSGELGTLSFLPLDGTKAEAEALKALLTPMFSDVEVRLGPQASEARLKQIESPHILHIATHGFFLNDQHIDLVPAPFSGSNLYSSGNDSEHNLDAIQVDNPLLRSGLALASANAPHPDTNSGEEDGILTALEVTGLDLRGTQLIVLSACDTALGEAVNGEGVYGLRRALVIAGVQSQVVSLWNVDDAVTKELMVSYYEKLLHQDAPLGRHEALRQVQLAMLQTPQSSHPYYWASFIASGNWRPLMEN